MNSQPLSEIASRKHQLNQLCASAVQQHISENKADNSHLRKRRRFLAKHVLKRLPLHKPVSSQRWLHAISLVLAMWGFNDLVMPEQAHAAFISDTVANPLNSVDVGTYSAPTFADIDGDGDLDAFVGAADGTVKYYRNTEIDAGANVGFIADGAGNPLAGVAAAGVKDGAYATPNFADLDNDGDLDAFIGEYYGTVKYYRNTEIDAGADVGFVADSAGNPLASVAVGFTAAPSFADIDSDGDIDAFIGTFDGSIKYYRNTEIDSVAQGTGMVADPFNALFSVAVGNVATPSFADIDGDGDLDAFVGEFYGSIKYYRNTAIDTGPDLGFIAEPFNPLALVEVGYTSAPSFADIDGDGDLDAFIGRGDGTIRYYRNSQEFTPTFTPIASSSSDIGMLSLWSILSLPFLTLLRRKWR